MSNENFDEILVERGLYSCESMYAVQKGDLNMKEGLVDVSSIFGLISIYLNDSVYVFDYQTFFKKSNFLDKYLFKMAINEVKYIKIMNYFNPKEDETQNNRPILIIITTNEIKFYSLEKNINTHIEENKFVINMIKEAQNNNYSNFINLQTYLFYLDNQQIKFINIQEEEEEEQSNLFDQEFNSDIEHICGNGNHILYIIKTDQLYLYNIYTQTINPVKNNIPKCFDLCSTFNNNLILFDCNEETNELIITFIDIQTRNQRSLSYYSEDIDLRDEIESQRFHQSSSNRIPLVLIGFNEAKSILPLYTESINQIKILNSKENLISPRPRSSNDFSNRLELNTIQIIENRTSDNFITNYSFCTTYGTESVFIYSFKGFEFPNMKPPPLSLSIKFNRTQTKELPKEESIQNKEETPSAYMIEKVDKLKVEKGSYSCKGIHAVQKADLHMKEGLVDVSSIFGLINIYLNDSVYVFDYQTFFGDEDFHDKYLYKIKINEVKYIKIMNYIDQNEEEKDEEEETQGNRPILIIVTTKEIRFYLLGEIIYSTNIIKEFENRNYSDFINLQAYLFYLDNQQIRFINIQEEEEESNLYDQEFNSDIEHICGSDNHILYIIKADQLYSYDIYAKEIVFITDNIPKCFDFCSTFNNNLILFNSNGETNKLIITFIDIENLTQKSFSYYSKEFNFTDKKQLQKFYKCSSNLIPLVLFTFNGLKNIYPLYTESIDKIKILNSKEEYISPRPRSSNNFGTRLELNAIQIIENRTSDDFITNYSFCTTYGTESVFIYSIEDFKYPYMQPPQANLTINYVSPKEYEKGILKEESGSYTCEAEHLVQKGDLHMKEGLVDVSSIFGLIAVYLNRSVYVFDYQTFFNDKDFLGKYLFKMTIDEVKYIKIMNYINPKEDETQNSRPILIIITTNEIKFYSLEKNINNLNMIKETENNNYSNFINLQAYLFYLDNQQIKFINIREEFEQSNKDHDQEIEEEEEEKEKKEEEEEEEEYCSKTNIVDNKINSNIKHICGSDNHILYIIKTRKLYSYDIYTKKLKFIKDYIPRCFDLCSTFNNNLILFDCNEDTNELIITFVDVKARKQKLFTYFIDEVNLKDEIESQRFHQSSSNRIPLVLIGFNEAKSILPLYTESINQIKILNSKENLISPRPRSSNNFSNRLELNTIQIIENRTSDNFITNYSFCTTYGTESIFIYSFKGFEFPNMEPPLLNQVIKFIKPKFIRLFNEEEEFNIDERFEDNEFEGIEELSDEQDESSTENDIEMIKEENGLYSCIAKHAILKGDLNMKEGLVDVSSIFGLIAVYLNRSVYVFDYQTFFKKSNFLDKYLFKMTINEVKYIKIMNYINQKEDETQNNRPILIIITTNEIKFYSLEKNINSHKIIKEIENNNYSNFINLQAYLFYLDNQQIKSINIQEEFDQSNKDHDQEIKEEEEEKEKEEEEEEEKEKEEEEEENYSEIDIDNHELNSNIKRICGSDNHILYFIKADQLYLYDIYTKEIILIKDHIPKCFDFCSTFNNNLILFDCNKETNELIITFIDIQTQNQKSLSFFSEFFNNKDSIDIQAFHKCSSSRFPLILFGFSTSTDIYPLYTKSIDNIKILNSKENIISPRPRSSIDIKNRLELNTIQFIENRTIDNFIDNYSFCTTYGEEGVFIYSIEGFYYPNMKPTPFNKIIKFNAAKAIKVYEEEDFNENEGFDKNDYEGIEDESDDQDESSIASGEDIEMIQEERGLYSCKAEYSVQKGNLHMKEGLVDVSLTFDLIAVYLNDSVYVFDYQTFFNDKDFLDKYLFKMTIDEVKYIKIMNYINQKHNNRPILIIITANEIKFYSLEEDINNLNMIKETENNNYSNFINLQTYLFYLDNQQIKFINIQEEEEEEQSNLFDQEFNSDIEHICGSDNHILYFIKADQLYSYDISTKKLRYIKDNVPKCFDFCSTFNNNLILFDCNKEANELIITFVDVKTRELKSLSYSPEDFNLQDEQILQGFRQSSSNQIPLVLFGFKKSQDILPLYTESIDKTKILFSKEEYISPRPRSSNDFGTKLELNTIQIIENPTTNNFITNYSFCTTYGTESIFIYSINGFEFPNMLPQPLNPYQIEEEEETIEDNSIEALGEERGLYTCKAECSVQKGDLNMKEGLVDVSSIFGLISIYLNDSVYVFDYQTFFNDKKFLDKYLFKMTIDEVKYIKIMNYINQKHNNRPILIIITTNEIKFYSLEEDINNLNMIKETENNNYSNFINLQTYLFYLDNQQIKFINIQEEEEESNLFDQEFNSDIEHICGSDNHILYFIKADQLYSYDIYTKEVIPITDNIPKCFDFCSTFNNNLILFDCNKETNELIITFIDIQTQNQKSLSYFSEDFNLQDEQILQGFRQSSSNQIPLVLFGFKKSQDILPLYTESIDKTKILFSKEEYISPRPRSSNDFGTRLELNTIQIIENRTSDNFITNYSFCTTYGTESVFFYSINGFDFPNMSPPPLNLSIKFGSSQVEVEAEAEEEDIIEDDGFEELKEEKGFYVCSSDFTVHKSNLFMKEGLVDYSSIFGLIAIYSNDSVYVCDHQTFFIRKNYLENYLFRITIDEVEYIKIMEKKDNGPILIIVTTNIIRFYLLNENVNSAQIIKEVKNNNYSNFINLQEFLFYLDNKQVKFINIQEEEEEMEIADLSNKDHDQEEKENPSKIDTDNREINSNNEHICGSDNHILYIIKADQLYSYDIYTKEIVFITDNIPKCFDFCSTINNNLILFNSNDRTNKLIITFIDIENLTQKSFSYYSKEFNFKDKNQLQKFYKCSSNLIPLVLFTFSGLKNIYPLYTESIDKIKILNSEVDFVVPRPQSLTNSDAQLELSSIQFIEQPSDNLINKYSFCAAYGQESVCIYSIMSIDRKLLIQSVQSLFAKYENIRELIFSIQNENKALISQGHKNLKSSSIYINDVADKSVSSYKTRDKLEQLQQLCDILEAEIERIEKLLDEDE